MNKPTRATVAVRVYLELQAKARQSDRMTGELFTLYALEGFLRRLAISDFSEDFVLKGGVLLAAYSARRPTRDIDFQARNLSHDVEVVGDRIRLIASHSQDDGLVFDASTVHGVEIRDTAEYPGVRVSINVRLSRATADFHLDNNFGDPIWPGSTIVSLPLVLGGTLPLRGYPLPMVLAEKTVTAVQRGPANTRWRDFADLVLLGSQNEISGRDFCRSLRVVADYRQVQLLPLKQVLDGIADRAQRQWSIWRRKQQLENQTAEYFQDVLDACSTLCDPAIMGTATDLDWVPSEYAWQRTLVQDPLPTVVD
ncbi:MAG: nucleotidyl transferase AbiEii/AbiGii toxin family protein [Thermomicrobiales bacterium]